MQNNRNLQYFQITWPGSSTVTPDYNYSLWLCACVAGDSKWVVKCRGEDATVRTVLYVIKHHSVVETQTKFKVPQKASKERTSDVSYAEFLQL